MLLIVDANILFAAVIKDSITAKLFLEENVDLYTPQFLFEEFEKYKDEILRKTKRTPVQFEKFMNFLKRKIIVIPKDYFIDFFKEADAISPDPKDVPYFALALNLGAGIWSNDKKLKNDQSTIQVFNTKELYEMFLQKDTHGN